jgi:hypothetical protein
MGIMVSDYPILLKPCPNIGSKNDVYLQYRKHSLALIALFLLEKQLKLIDQLGLPNYLQCSPVHRQVSELLTHIG